MKVAQRASVLLAMVVRPSPSSACCSCVAGVPAVRRCYAPERGSCAGQMRRFAEAQAMRARCLTRLAKDCNLSVLRYASSLGITSRASWISALCTLLELAIAKDSLYTLRMATARCALALALLAAPSQALAARRRSPVRMSDSCVEINFRRPTPSKRCCPSSMVDFHTGRSRRATSSS